MPTPLLGCPALRRAQCRVQRLPVKVELPAPSVISSEPDDIMCFQLELSRSTSSVSDDPSLFERLEKCVAQSHRFNMSPRINPPHVSLCVFGQPDSGEQHAIRPLARRGFTL